MGQDCGNADLEVLPRQTWSLKRRSLARGGGLRPARSVTRAPRASWPGPPVSAQRWSPVPQLLRPRPCQRSRGDGSTSGGPRAPGPCRLSPASPRVGSQRTHPGCPWHLRHGGKRHVASPLSSRGHVGNGWRWKLCAFFVNLPGGRGPVCPSRCLRPGDAPLGRQGPSTLVAPGSGSFHFLRRRKVYDVPVFVSIPRKLRAPQPEVPVIIFS